MIRLGILISGGGTTFLNLHRRIKADRLQAEIGCVISSSRKAKGLGLAAERGYPAYVVPRRRFADDRAFSDAINAYLRAHDVELVVLGGFLKKYLPDARYRHACINIHPALIPAFCGPGYYGMRVHEAVWRRGCRYSGCTVHFVNDEYDAGPIILQKVVELDPLDDPEAIRAKVFQAECDALPEAITQVASGRLRIADGRVYFDR